MDLRSFAKLAARRRKSAQVSERDERNRSAASTLPAKGPDSKSNGSESDYAEDRSAGRPTGPESQLPPN